MKMSVEQAYKILAVSKSADIKAIKKKYRKLMLKVHPDSLKSGKNTYQSVSYTHLTLPTT